MSTIHVPDVCFVVVAVIVIFFLFIWRGMEDAGCLYLFPQSLVIYLSVHFIVTPVLVSLAYAAALPKYDPL